MKVLVAPNAFKGSLGAREAALAIARGVRRAEPGAEIVLLPVSDGGDGVLDVLESSLGAVPIARTVTGPRGAPVEAASLWIARERTAFVSLASASGLALLAPAERDPTRTTTRGTGELVRAALDESATRIAIGIGGSATNDGGAGAAAALGYRFFDGAGRAIDPTGGTLASIRRIDSTGRDPRLARTVFEAMCDVANPLLGERGAARTYAPQKGATAAQVELLEAGLENLANLIERDLGNDVRTLEGGGAAGGFGAGACAFLGATLRRGSDVVLDLLHFDEALERGADLVITGEGRLDEQTSFGKAPASVAARARAAGVTCVALAGRVTLDRDAVEALGFERALGLCEDESGEGAAIREVVPMLEAAAERVVREARQASAR